MNDTADRDGAGLSLSVFQQSESMQVATAVLEAIPAMVAIFDKDLRYVYCNRRYVSMANAENPTAWRGRLITDYLPARTLAEALPRIRRALSGEHVSYYLELPQSDGTSRTVVVNYVPMEAPDGSVLFLMTGQDATELKAAEQRLFAAQKLETVGRITGGIAHDFNNNIGVVIGNLSLLRMRLQDPELLGFVDSCRSAADRCGRLTSQLLTFARRQPIQPRPLSVKDNLEAIRELMRVSVPSNIQIEFVHDAPDSVILVDETQFENAIMNLIFNARDAMSEGGKITVTVAAAQHRGGRWTRLDHDSPKADAVLIEVADEGTGMPRHVADRAFEPFFTTKEYADGSGMGLATVDAFIRQCRGFIELQSAPSHGTMVRLYLPSGKLPKSSINADEAGQRKPSKDAKHTVLVVEDQTDVSTVICQLLQAIGHDTMECDTVDCALSLLEKSKDIDVVLTDIMLRDRLTGIDLRNIVVQRFPHVRVICMSGYQDQKSKIKSELDPSLELLVKPFSMEQLASRIAGRPLAG